MDLLDEEDEKNLYGVLEGLFTHPDSSARLEHLKQFDRNRHGGPNTEGLLKLAEELGWVDRFCGVASDGRFTRYNLTEEGIKQLADYRDISVDKLNEDRPDGIRECLGEEFYHSDVRMSLIAQYTDEI